MNCDAEKSDSRAMNGTRETGISNRSNCGPQASFAVLSARRRTLNDLNLLISGYYMLFQLPNTPTFDGVEPKRVKLNIFSSLGCKVGAPGPDVSRAIWKLRVDFDQRILPRVAG